MINRRVFGTIACGLAAGFVTPLYVSRQRKYKVIRMVKIRNGMRTFRDRLLGLDPDSPNGSASRCRRRLLIKKE